MKKILVAEDDQFLSNAYRVKLTKSGFDVKIATDGDEAITMANQFVPDLIVLDLMMPKKDGFTTLEEFRKNEQFKTTPIIVASNLGQQEDLDRAKSLGANDYLVKSDMSLDDLIKKINAFLNS